MSPDAQTATAPDALAALEEVLFAVVDGQVEATHDRVREILRETLQLCLNSSEVIARVIGEDRTRVLAAVFKLLAEDSVDAPGILRTFVERFQRLQNVGRSGGGLDGSAAIDVERLRAELAEKLARVTELEAEVARIAAELVEAKRIAKLAKIASGDIVKLREALLAQLTGLAASIDAAVLKVRDREGDGALAAYLEFLDISDIDVQCLEIFRFLRPEVMGKIGLYRTVLAEYEELSRAIQAADKVPSLDLYRRSALLLGRLQSLKELQDQLILDQMGGQGLEVPNDWLDESGGLLDFYSILGVSPDDTNRKIKGAYRKKARECHPDMNPGGGNGEMSKLTLARDVLLDPEKRALYDRARGFSGKS